MNYEIRILRDDGRVSFTATHVHGDDQAAIQSALKLAKVSRFEVWRGEECVYSAPESLDDISDNYPCVTMHRSKT